MFDFIRLRGMTMRKTLLAAAPILMIALAPTSSRADSVGAAFGAGTGLVVAGPVGAVIGGVVGWYWGTPFWGPPNSPRACWIDNSFHRHCRY
jgi:osmotically inducible lipoprotein OsmB